MDALFGCPDTIGPTPSRVTSYELGSVSMRRSLTAFVYIILAVGRASNFRVLQLWSGKNAAEFAKGDGSRTRDPEGQSAQEGTWKYTAGSTAVVCDPQLWGC